jgi:hypothetical protein
MTMTTTGNWIGFGDGRHHVAIRDLTDAFRMYDGTFAGLFTKSSRYEESHQYFVAWGNGYSSIQQGGKWNVRENSVLDGAVEFISLEEAEEYVRDVTDCYA